MLVYFSCEVKIFGDSGFLPVNLNVGDSLLHRTVMTEVNLQCLLLSALRCIGPITLRGFLDTVDIRVLTPAYPDFLEIVSVVVIIERVYSEDLLTLDWCQTEYGCYILVSVLELGLVEKNLDIGVVDDSLLDNRRVNDIVKLLRNNTGNAMKLADCLIDRKSVV